MTTIVTTIDPASTPPATRITLEPELVSHNRQLLKQAVLDLLASGARSIEIDFTNTGYIDSSGLGVLVSIRRACHDRDATLVLVGVNEELRALMHMIQLESLFTFAAP